MTLARAEPGGPAPPWGVRETRASCSRRGGGLGTLQIFPRRVVTLCSFGLCISALLRIRPSRAFFNPAYWRIRGTPFYPISGTEMALLKAAPERREHLSILSDIYARPLCRPVQRQKKGIITTVPSCAVPTIAHQSVKYRSTGFLSRDACTGKAVVEHRTGCSFLRCFLSHPQRYAASISVSAESAETRRPPKSSTSYTPRPP